MSVCFLSCRGLPAKTFQIPQNTQRLHPPQYLRALRVYWDEQRKAENIKPILWKCFRGYCWGVTASLSCYQGVPFKRNFMSVAKTILKRLFRVYAHIYHQHFDSVMQLQEEAHLNTSFKHFIFFVQVKKKKKVAFEFWLLFLTARIKNILVNLISPFPFTGVQPHWQERVGPTSGADWKTDNQG